MCGSRAGRCKPAEAEASVNVFFVEEDFWPLNTVLYVKDFHGTILGSFFTC